MGETERKARKIRISNNMLIALAAVLILTLAVAAFIIPRYGKVFAEFREQTKIYSSAHSELTAQQERNAELTKQLEEFRTLSGEIQTSSNEVFALAAQLEKDIQEGKTDKRICYITIDDGPYKRGNEFLKIFNTYDIKATFFLSTANGNKLPDQGDVTAASMYPEYLKYGHTIGNHSYSHDYSNGGIYKSAKAFMKDIEKQQNFTAENTGGYRPKIIRFPGGTATAGSKLEDIQAALREAGYGWINWTVDSGDSFGSDVATEKFVKENVLKAAKEDDQKIMVVLFHEWSKASQAAMPEIIETLESEGYVFLPLFYDSVMVEK